MRYRRKRYAKKSYRRGKRGGYKSKSRNRSINRYRQSRGGIRI